MSIIKYQDYYDVGQAGQVATLEDSNIKTRNAQEVIGFGKGVVKGSTGGTDVKNIAKNIATLDFDADFVTSNTINLNVNGVAISEVTFDTDQATTKAALVAAIDALTGISAVDAASRAITITTDAGDNITVSDIVVAAGASQANGSVAYTSSDVVEGISALRHGQPVTIGGDDAYQINDAVNVLTKGVIWVNVIATVAYGDSVYIANDKTDSANQGNFTNASSGNLAVSSAKFVSAATGTTGTPALAKVEINQP
jgi:hypothetical protein